MNFLGIDVASKKLNIHITGEKGGDYEIPNTREELEDFVRENNISPDRFITGAESTGKYHLTAQEFFVEQGFEFRLINPICTRQAVKATVRKKKTDCSDAYLIAFMLSRGAGNKITAEQLYPVKRNLLRTRDTLNKHRKALMLLKGQLEKDTCCKELKAAIKSIKDVIKKMESSADEIEKEALKADPNDDEKLIRSIPGFAALLSAVVSSEVGDFSRFPSSSQFKAYVGIDPKVIQSGNSQRYGKITKRGKPHLRCAFYLAAQIARQHDSELKAYYEKKRTEGKPYRLVICAVARKLCERVYSVVTRGTPYEIRKTVSA